MGYNETVHNAIGMAPTRVSDKNILAIWQRLQTQASRVHSVKVKYCVGQLVWIRKEKAKFAKCGEQNYTTEVFRIIKLIRRSPQPVYELED
jgi:hypothetical protein